jgi:hypothetical protein
VSFQNKKPYYFLEKSKKSTTLLVLAVYCLLYKHMQEYRHAGLISHSCAPFPVGRKLASNPPPLPGGQTDSFARFFCNVLSCQMLLQLNCKLVYNIYNKTPKIFHIYSKVYLTISRVYCTYSKEKTLFRLNQIKHLMYGKISII